MLKVYGTNTCPDCVDCKANFDYHKIPYEYIDVCESVKTLKEFIQLRDTSPLFDEIKSNGSVGIPCIIKEDGTITFDWQQFVLETGNAIVHVSNGQACGLDGKGC